MKKVIDAGALRSAELREYLSASRSHYAVLSDYAAMESFKGNGSVNVRLSLQILSEYPGQVLVLKSTNELCRLRPRSKGIQSRFVDQKQTKGFSNYCAAVLSNRIDVHDDISLKESQSRSHFDRLAGSVEQIRMGLGILAQSFSPHDMRSLRRSPLMSKALSNRMMTDILRTAASHFKNLSGVSAMPTLGDALYSFPFRYALCSYALSIKWITDGGYQTVAANKLKNDYTDMTYAAYASFFDGLITKDQKLMEVYQIASWIWREWVPQLQPPK